MSKIKKLDSSIYNKIAAGEVVERPSSVVKELVENAIDANADIISVFIREGGLSEITVSDNGIGIQKEDLPIAFFPHATSKIAEADDLFSIASLGFRGEALASIAAVSHTKIKSKYFDDDSGYMLEISAGNAEDIIPCGIAQGTTISVNNLFFNTPARLKFLKKPRYEENEIVSLITKFILANPKISFSCSNENGVLIKSDGNGLYEAILNVFDMDIAENLLSINNTRGSISVSGYISNTNYSKSNRTYQTILINGRIINNITISTAINNAYSHYLMKRCYPIIVMNIRIPFDEVDVNVHPSKTDVRFADNNKIFSIVFATIKEALDNYEKARAISFSNQIAATQEEELEVESANIQSQNYQYELNLQEKNSSFFEQDNSVAKVCEDSGIMSKIKSIFENNFDSGNLDTIDTTKDSFDNSKNNNSHSSIKIGADYKIIGQAFGTYIILEHEDDLILIDQHAAAERVLFDRLYKEYSSGEIAIQPMLVPYIFTVNASEQSIIADKLNILYSIGIDIEYFGNNSYKINALPMSLIDMNFDKLTAYLLDDNKNMTNDALREKLMYMACRSAIKGNTRLDEEGIKLLIDNLFNNEIPMRCPHGRPSYIKLSIKDLAKMFKRIV